METEGGIKIRLGYKDLEIWQLGIKLAVDTYRATESFPPEDKFGLVSQLRRASVSVPSNISEGWGRDTQSNLANSVRIARGSLYEVETLLEISGKLGLIQPDQLNSLIASVSKLSPKISRFLRKVEETYVREELEDYLEEFGLGGD